MQILNKASCGSQEKKRWMKHDLMTNKLLAMGH